jgi:TRAP-type transport system large permease protein
MTLGLLVLTLFGSIFLLLLLGLPIGFAIFSGTLLSMIQNELPLRLALMSAVAGSQSFILTAIPFFTLAGILMREGGITRRIIDSCLLMVGHYKGSLGHVNIASSMIFGGISGSSVADTASIGNVLIPEMVRNKYPADFSAAITAVSSTIGIVIPPSIPMILYAMASEVSVGKLFLAGATPGILIGLLQMVINSIVAHRRGFERHRDKRARLPEILHGLKAGIFAIGMPMIIIGGIVLGIVTATEAAVLAVMYALFIGFFVYKELTVSKLPAILLEAVLTTGVVLFIVVAASSLGWFLAYARVPQLVSESLLALSANPLTILLIINLILLVVGMVSDLAPNILILTPIFLPIITMLGIDPVYFGIVVIVNQAIALVTPPVGNCLYICSNLARVSVEKVFIAGLPFMAANLIVLILIVFFPDICMWLPNLLM